MATPYWCALEDNDGELMGHRPVSPRRRPSPDPQERWSADGTESITVWCSRHAGLRRAQRSIRLDQLRYVLLYGAPVRRTGATFLVLRHCDIAPGDLRRDDIARLDGVVALVEGDTVITVYRNHRSYRQIHKKPKYARRQSRGEAPGREDAALLVAMSQPAEAAAA